ncbi:MAG: hypothetical protein AMXMBFR48_10090 [Ignavibacteriales bacterium]
MITDLLIALLLFVSFAVVHTATAGTGMKQYILSRYPRFSPFYRLAYNLLSFFTFWLFYELSPKPHYILVDLQHPWDLLILIPKIIAAAGFIYTFQHFDGAEFLGIKQAIVYIRTGKAEADPDAGSVFTAKGPYRYSRHPLYFFLIIFLLAHPFVNWFYAMVTLFSIIYFYVGSWYEERKLLERFGAEYAEYKRRVPRIFPWDFF